MSITLMLRAATAPPETYRTPAHKLAMLCLADSAGDGDGIALPGQDALEAWSCLNRSQLYKVLADLMEDGLLERVSAGHRGRRARFRVFPASFVPEPGDGQSPVDKSSEKGSGVPDSTSPAPAMGPERVRKGSGKGPAATLDPCSVRSPLSGVPSNSRRAATEGVGVTVDGATKPLSREAAEALRARAVREDAKARGSSPPPADWREQVEQARAARRAQ